MRIIAGQPRRTNIDRVTATTAPLLRGRNKQIWILGARAAAVEHREAARSPTATAIFSVLVRLIFEST